MSYPRVLVTYGFGRRLVAIFALGGILLAAGCGDDERGSWVSGGERPSRAIPSCDAVSESSLRLLEGAGELTKLDDLDMDLPRSECLWGTFDDGNYISVIIYRSESEAAGSDLHGTGRREIDDIAGVDEAYYYEAVDSCSVSARDGVRVVTVGYEPRGDFTESGCRSTAVVIMRDYAERNLGR